MCWGVIYFFDYQLSTFGFIHLFRWLSPFPVDGRLYNDNIMGVAVGVGIICLCWSWTSEVGIVLISCFDFPFSELWPTSSLSLSVPLYLDVLY
jgi:hypothetical protein